jgi:hypothetical protein
MAVQLTSVNGQLFSNNQPIGGTTSRQYLLTSDTNILINEDTTMTICNNNVNSAFNKLGGGTNGSVNALARDSSGNLYVGGSFTTVTNSDGTSVSANNIAKWDPISNTWSALGGGASGGGGSSVNALACDSNGNLYVGGTFTSVGTGLSANNIAKWNLSNWSALGGGASRTVRALAFDSNGNLYVGGSFTTVTNSDGTGVSASCIAKWNINSTWSALGGGASGAGASSSVNALACDSSGNLYVGGTFTSVGTGLSANNIAKWNLSNWSALGGGANGTVNALAFDSNGNLYVGGSFTSLGTGLSASCIAKWNINSTWSALGGGAGSGVSALAFDSNGNLYVGGSFTYVTNTNNTSLYAYYIVKWKNDTWFPFGSGTNSNVYALSVDSNSNLYVGGAFTYVNGVASTNRIAKILPNTIINISINGNYLTTLIPKQYQGLNYFKENSRIYKTFNGI